MASTSGTGVPNPVYDLTSVLYHALQGAEIYERYAKDAAADRELAEFFREAKEQNEQRAQRALRLLARHAQK